MYLLRRLKGVNWSFLINQEEKSLLKIYKFINFYIDVPHLKHSFKRRKLLGWLIKKVITYKQSSSYTYLFSHLFIRYNEFYYLYVRLTLIGIGISYFFPAYGWIVAFPLLFLSGYQLLPLQYSINDSSRIYPVSTKTLKQSFQKLLMSLLIVQLLFFNLASFSPIFDHKSRCTNLHGVVSYILVCLLFCIETHFCSVNLITKKESAQYDD